MDIVRAIRRFKAKYTGQYLSDVIAAQKSEMVAAFTTRTQELVALQSQVFGILAGESVLTVNYHKYLSFAATVYRKQNQLGGGNGLIEEVALLVTKWKGRGCVEATLNKIRNECFAIPAPTGP